MFRQGASKRSISDLGVQITPEIQAIAADIVSWRRQLHQHPELGTDSGAQCSLISSKCIVNIEILLHQCIYNIVKALRRGGQLRFYLKNCSHSAISKS